jgi:hypothetical protein
VIDERAERWSGFFLRTTLVCPAGLSFIAVCVSSTLASETEGERADHGSNSDQEPKENGMLTSTVREMNARVTAEVPAICLRARLAALGSSRSFKSSIAREGGCQEAIRVCYEMLRSTLRSCYPTNEGQRGQSQSVFVPLPLRVKLRPRPAGSTCPISPQKQTSSGYTLRSVQCQQATSAPERPVVRQIAVSNPSGL